MRGYQKRLKKLVVLFLVFSVLMSVIRPQINNPAYAEEQNEEQNFNDTGNFELGTPGDAAEDVSYAETADVTKQDEKNDSDNIIDESETANDEGKSEAIIEDIANGQTEDVSDEKETEEQIEDEEKELFVYVPESGCSVTIKAPAGSLPYDPKELTVSVRELKSDTLEYAAYFKAAVHALNQDNAENISFARFFDIEILNNGEKVEPILPVEVKIEYDDVPEIANEDEISIVHFAKEGTEVITDIELNENATEIVYEQESFSITATIATTPPVAVGLHEGHDYVLVAVFDGNAYTVQNDGSLKQVTDYDAINDKITEDATFAWKYTRVDSKTYLHYISDGFAYNEHQLATEYAYTSLAPDDASGLVVSTPSYNDDKTKSVNRDSNGKVIYDNYPEGYSVIYENNEIRSEKNNYLTISADKTRIQGNATNPDDGVKFYLYKVDGLLDEYDYGYGKPYNHVVNHIDIAISDTVEVDIPLAYGNYYDKNGNLVMTVDREHYPDGYDLRVSQVVTVNQEQLRKAEIKAYKAKSVDANNRAIPDTNELPNAFYITGYSANAETDRSYPQVRIEGIFKIATCAPGNNSDATTKANRLNSRVVYTVEAVQPNVRFYYTNPYDPNEHLYDDKGKELYIETDVTIRDSFDYFDPRNECPPLHGTKYTTYPGKDFETYWQAGEMHGWGISGMDFLLSGDATISKRPFAIEIENKIIDTDGNPIIPRDKITGFKFGVYVDQAGDSDSVVGKNINGYDGYEANTSSYNKEKEKTIDIDNDPSKNATNIVYDYDLPEGMIYIDEDKNTVPEIITDKDGNRWVYKKTFIETEYVWRRNDPNNNSRHFSNDYNESDSSFDSVPEVIGTYSDGFNKFLEFYVRNVYEKIEPPTKKEVSPYEGNGTLGEVKVGDEIAYEISYKNYKNRTADVVIKDKLDANVEFVSASDNGVYDKASHSVIWTLKDVASEKEGKVKLKVKVLEGAIVENNGPGKVVNGGDTATVKVGNDDEFTLEVVENPVTKTPAKKETAPYEGSGTLGSVKVGDEITYEILYKNYMSDTANVIIKDKLDKNVSYVSSTGDGVYDASTHTVIWTIKNVPSGTEGKVKLKVKVLESARVSKGGPGKVVNGGETSTVKVGNDSEVKLEIVENPIDESTTEVTPPQITTTSTTTNKSVKTGDTFNFGIIIALMLISLAGIVILNKKEKQ